MKKASENYGLSVVGKPDSLPECPQCGSTTGVHDPAGLCYAREFAALSTREQRAVRPDDQSLWGMTPSELDDMNRKLIGTAQSENTSIALSRPVTALDQVLSEEDRTHLGLYDESRPLPPRKTGLVPVRASSTSLTAPFRVDGSRHKGTHVWAGFATFERLWREVAAARLELLIKPEVLPLVYREDPTVRFRYLEASHLKDPWTPGLVMNLWWMHAMMGNYRRYEEQGHFVPWWDGPDPSDPNATMGERIFQISEHTFREAGLSDMLAQAEEGHAIYRKRVLWLRHVNPYGWKKFTVGIVECRTIQEILHPEAWHTLVMTIRATRPDDWAIYLKRMRQAGVGYQPPMGMFTPREPLYRYDSPPAPKVIEPTYFGNLAAHTSDVSFGEWAERMMPRIDLFSAELW